MKSIYKGLSIVASIVLSNSLSAQKGPADFGMDINKPIPKGLEVGAKVPDMKMTSIDGSPEFSLKSMYKKGPVVVMFYRGEWCPVCNKYLSGINDSLKVIEKLGAKILIISPELAENAAKTKKNTHSKWTFISDHSLNIEKSFDVLYSVTDGYQKKLNTMLSKDINENNGSMEAMLPVPATYVIDRKGKITYKQFNYDYSVRASATEIYDAVKKTL